MKKMITLILLLFFSLICCKNQQVMLPTNSISLWIGVTVQVNNNKNCIFGTGK